MKHLLIGLIILIGVGCTQQQPAGGGNPNQPTSLPQGPNGGGSNDADPIRSNGTGHSGGANGLGGVALENHKINLNDLPVYAKVVLPLLEELRATVPDLTSDLEAVFKKKIWHVVDKKLSAISSDNLSVAFATEQLALQNIYEVWIYKNAFEKMSEHEQATLLIHEALMGIKISRSIDYKKRLNPNYLDGFERLKNKLEGKNILQIDTVDYEQIRTMTSRLLEKQFQVDLPTFIQDLQSMGFGDFITAEQKKDLHTFYAKEFSAKEILEYLDGERQVNQLPAGCKLSLDLANLKLNIETTGLEKNKRRAYTFSDETSRSTISRAGEVTLTLVEKSDAGIRNSRNSVRIKIQNDRIQSLESIEEIYTFELKGFNWKVKKDSSFVCELPKGQ